MAFNPDTPLDLYSLFVTGITGTGGIGEAIFIFASIFLIARFAASMKFPNIITIALFGIFGLIMGVLFPSLLVITLFIISILIFLVFNRMVNK